MDYFVSVFIYSRHVGLLRYPVIDDGGNIDYYKTYTDKIDITDVKSQKHLRHMDYLFPVLCNIAYSRMYTNIDVT
jgi:hypothetical protein